MEQENGIWPSYFIIGLLIHWNVRFFEEFNKHVLLNHTVKLLSNKFMLKSVLPRRRFLY